MEEVAPKRKKRKTTKAQNKKWQEGVVNRTLAEAKRTVEEKTGREDVRTFPVYKNRSELYKTLKLFIDEGLLKACKRIGEERITYKNGNLTLQGDSSIYTNTVNGYIKSIVMGRLSNPPEYLLKLKYVPEHVTSNKCDYSRDNVYWFVHDAMNKIFKTSREKSAERTCPVGGVMWVEKNNGKKYQKWRVQIKVEGVDKSFGYYKNEEEAKYIALKIYDRVKKNIIYRTVIHLYNEKGEFEPYVKVYDKASDVIKLMRKNILYNNSPRPGWKYTTDEAINAYLDGKFEEIENPKPKKKKKKKKLVSKKINSFFEPVLKKRKTTTEEEFEIMKK